MQIKQLGRFAIPQQDGEKNAQKISLHYLTPETPKIIKFDAFVLIITKVYVVTFFVAFNKKSLHIHL